MKFVNSYQEKDTNDWIFEFEASNDELDIIRKVEQENHMSIQDITTSWLRWLVNNPIEGKELLLKWKQEEELLKDMKMCKLIISDAK